MGAFRKFVAGSVWSLLAKPPLTLGLKAWYGGFATILALHRVVPSGEGAVLDQNVELEITPEDLESLIQHFINRKYAIVSMDDLFQRLNEGHTKEKCVVFTFDDGYVDNFERALPLFRKYRAPMTVYVATEFPDRLARLWWYVVEDRLLSREEISFVHDGKKYDFALDNQAQKNLAFAAIKRMILACPVQTQSKLFEALGISDENFKRNSERLAISWEKLREMATDPLVTIGSHTVHHRQLARLTDQELAAELNASKKELETRLGKSVQHFAYPFGDADSCDEREFRAAREAGYTTAVTTRVGNIFDKHKHYLCCLPRQSLAWGKQFSLNKLDLQMSGYPLIRAHKLSRVVTN